MSRRHPGTVRDHIPTAPAVEVICITLLINRPPRRELRIGNRECDARPDGEQLRRSNNKGVLSQISIWGQNLKIAYQQCNDL